MPGWLGPLHAQLAALLLAVPALIWVVRHVSEDCFDLLIALKKKYRELTKPEPKDPPSRSRAA